MEKRTIYEWYNRFGGQFYTINETIYKGKTKFQEAEVVDTDMYGKVLLLDGFTQVVQNNEYEYHEIMVHPAMIAHNNPQDILIIGGGDGGILREVYKYNSVRSVDFVELDDEVVEICKKYLPFINAGSFEDKRTKFYFEDGRKFVFETDKKYDVIIMDMTDPFGPSEMLYTVEFFEAIKKIFKDDKSFFVMHSESPVARPLAFGSIRQTLSLIFPKIGEIYSYVQMYGTIWSVAISSISGSISEIDKRIVEEKIKNNKLENLKIINSKTFFSLQTRFPYIDEILNMKHKIIRDTDSIFPDIYQQQI